METSVTARLERWADVPLERMKGTITRQIITGDSAMLGMVRFAKGDFVPTHAHPNEQLTYVFEGALKFELGEERREVVVRKDEVLVIPRDVPHSAEALEDTVEMDVFAPPREDWLAKTDAYLRG